MVVLLEYFDNFIIVAYVLNQLEQLNEYLLASNIVEHVYVCGLSESTLLQYYILK